MKHLLTLILAVYFVARWTDYDFQKGGFPICRTHIIQTATHDGRVIRHITSESKDCEVSHGWVREIEKSRTFHKLEEAEIFVKAHENLKNLYGQKIQFQVVRVEMTKKETPVQERAERRLQEQKKITEEIKRGAK